MDGTLNLRNGGSEVLAKKRCYYLFRLCDTENKCCNVNFTAALRTFANSQDLLRFLSKQALKPLVHFSRETTWRIILAAFAGGFNAQSAILKAK